MSSFEESKSELQELIKASFVSQDLQTLEKKYESLNGGEADKRTLMDQSLRDHLLFLVTNHMDNMNIFNDFISFVIELSKREMCPVSSPVVLLSDLLDIFTLDKCEIMFNFVEENVSVWKQELFFSACKNHLLRMCNDLLRRLSRSQNTVFRGRILLFLAKFFPFSERSGLNIVSEFNLDNVTEFIEDNVNNMDVDEVEDETDSEKKFKIDYNLYSKFLTLQDFFRSPTQCYNKVKWRVFVNSSTDVLSAFSSFKLDNVNFDTKSPRELLSEMNEVFFAKYLTNPKLLELQLSDANFRRSLLIQLLVVFQYLTATIKFKSENFELKPEQTQWVKEQTQLVYKLLSETPAGSQQFADSVKHILNREELWSNWKNDGCPEFKVPTDLNEEGDTPGRTRGRPRRRNVGHLLKDAAQQGKYYMGHPELTRLWNINPNNLESCRGKERDFLPKLEDYFDEAIAQLDPSAGVEEEYKKVNDGNFGWRGLRLLAQRSPYFFTHTNNPISKLPDYLTINLKKLAKDLPQQINGGAGVGGTGEDDEESEVVIKQEQAESQEDNIEQEEINTVQTRRDQKIPSELLSKIAECVGDGWKKLAVKIGFDKELVTELESTRTNSRDCAESMLRIWSDEDVDATVENLEYMLEGLEFFEAAKVLQVSTDSNQVVALAE